MKLTEGKLQKGRKSIMSAVASPKEFITRALRAYETQEEAKIIVKARESARSKPNQTKSTPSLAKSI